jgi:hypothetical protein
MSTNIIAIFMAVLLSLGLACCMNNAMDKNELTSKGFSFYSLAHNSVGDTVGFWSMGDTRTSDPINLYLDYGVLYQFNHWIVVPQSGFSTKHLSDVATWNRADIQAYPELYSQNYNFIELGDNLGGTWENGGSMVYYFFGPGKSYNGWADKNYLNSVSVKDLQDQTCEIRDERIKNCEKFNRWVDKNYEETGSVNFKEVCPDPCD